MGFPANQSAELVHGDNPVVRNELMYPPSFFHPQADKGEKNFLLSGIPGQKAGPDLFIAGLPHGALNSLYHPVRQSVVGSNLPQFLFPAGLTAGTGGNGDAGRAAGGAAFGIGVKNGGEKAFPGVVVDQHQISPVWHAATSSRPGSVRCPAAGDSRKSGGGGASNRESWGGISAGSSPGRRRTSAVRFW